MMPYLEVKTVEQLWYKCKRGEEDLQGVDVCSMSLTQVDRSLEKDGQKKSVCCEHFLFNRTARPDDNKQKQKNNKHSAFTLKSSVRGWAKVSNTNLISCQSSLDLNSCRYLTEKDIQQIMSGDAKMNRWLYRVLREMSSSGEQQELPPDKTLKPWVLDHHQVLWRPPHSIAHSRQVHFTTWRNYGVPDIPFKERVSGAEHAVDDVEISALEACYHLGQEIRPLLREIFSPDDADSVA